MLKRKGGAAHGVSGIFANQEVCAKHVDGFTVFNDPVNGERNEFFVVEIPGAALVARLHCVGCLLNRNESDAPFFQDMPAAGVVKVRMGEKTVFYVLRIQPPVFHVSEYLIHRVATPAVKHD